MSFEWLHACGLPAACLRGTLFCMVSPRVSPPHHPQTCSVSHEDIKLIIGVTVGVGAAVVVGCVIYWYLRCQRSAESRRFRRYEQTVNKQKAKLAERAEERSAARKGREAEIRGKYGLWKDGGNDAKTPLVENGGYGGRY